MHVETVRFPGGKGNELAGRVDHPVGDIRGWAIVAHCFTCSKQSKAAVHVARGLAERGIGVLRFDFTGLGESDGDFASTDFSSNVADLVAAAEWMKAEGRTPGLLVGHSLGGSAVIVAARRLPDLKAVATINAPSDAGHVIQQFADDVDRIERDGVANVKLAGRPFTITREFVEDVRASNVGEAVRALRRPVLFLHAPEDEVVGIENASALFTSALHPKSFVSLDGADHFLRNTLDGEFAASVIAGWASRYLDGDLMGDRINQTDEVIVRETLEAGPFQNEVFIDGQRHIVDEPEDLGGSGTGPTPDELLSAGLGACTSMTLRMYADKKGWPLHRVTVRLNHQKVHAEDCVECGPRDKIDLFSREVELEGPLNAEQSARLLEIADRCPVHRTLESGARVETRAAGPVSEKSQ